MHFKSDWLAVAVLALFGLGLTGCQPPGPVKYPVVGTVTWNGAPLDSGDILLVPADGVGIPEAAKVQAGQFEVASLPGKMKVEIRATRVGPVDPVMGAPRRIQFVPARYNDATELTTEVLAVEINSPAFDLNDSPP